MTAAREGLHAGEAQYARLKSIPRRANRSIFGVLMGPPYGVIQSFISSTAMNKTFGFCLAVLANCAAHGAAAANPNATATASPVSEKKGIFTVEDRK
jgi:hypothetical protein